MKLSPKSSNILQWAAVVIIPVALVTLFAWPEGDSDTADPTLDEFQAKIEAGEVATAEIKDRSNKITGTYTDEAAYSVDFPDEYTDELTALLVDAGVETESSNQQDPTWKLLLYNYLPLLIIVGALLYLVWSMQEGKGMKLGRSKARPAEEPSTTFADVAGCVEAVEELEEVRDFLSNPDRFHAVGAKIPKGILLVGPPGTGKTLLARAVAGEAGVPFYSLSGSDFVEMFVGVGASRVRELFNKAKEHAPAIIFVDEIDAVGRHRGAGVGGGHDEREQTLNQLLVEMDGFDDRSHIILMAATNRPDILDPALLRPGRFDRQVVVDHPDLEGRRAILAVHGKGKPLADEIDFQVLARRTPGFTGADLANLLNEAALLAARRNHDTISQAEIDEATDRVLGGPQRKSRVLSDREKRITAYHEAGHTLVGYLLPHSDPIHKVSIVARGRALGWTLSLPDEDRRLQTRSELRDRLTMLLGGRTAEELVFGDPTTGASDDIAQATLIARAMITEFGMSDLGPRQLGHGSSAVFLGKEMGRDADYSHEVAAAIDAELSRLIDAAHHEARELLTMHRVTLDLLAERLVDHETLGEAEIKAILSPLEPWVSHHVDGLDSRTELLVDIAD